MVIQSFAKTSSKGSIVLWTKIDGLSRRLNRLHDKCAQLVRLEGGETRLGPTAHEDRGVIGTIK
jgi:hypothetical protein